jgi:hypothetical protein
MAKYRLLAKHYMNDRLLDEGTIVGDETSFVIPEGGVTPEMEGLDDEGKAAVKKVTENLTKPLNTASPLGLLFLEPEVQTALVALAKSQAGAGVGTQAKVEPARVK